MLIKVNSPTIIADEIDQRGNLTKLNRTTNTDRVGAKNSKPLHRRTTHKDISELL